MDSLIQVRQPDEKILMAHIEMKLDPMPPFDGELIPIAENCFSLLDEQGVKIINVAFIDDKKTGLPEYVFFGDRLVQRCAR